MALLVRVDEIVRLQQDLVVDAADVRIGMVVPASHEMRSTSGRAAGSSVKNVSTSAGLSSS